MKANLLPSLLYRKYFDAVDAESRTAIRSARRLSGLLSGRRSG
jgi:hypothetical protein